MNRSAAIVVLAGFGLAFLVTAWWGLSEIRAAMAEIERKACPVVIDTSAFWFVGCGALALVLLCIVVVRPWLQNTIIGLSIALFIGLPIASFAWFSASATAGGYGTEALSTPFMLQSVDLRHEGCT
jgi:glucan phosphoethanolaminetransferase (alkaline phosphatase superfamily)